MGWHNPLIKTRASEVLMIYKFNANFLAEILGNPSKVVFGINMTNELNRSRLNIARCDLENSELEHIVAFMILEKLMWEI